MLIIRKFSLIIKDCCFIVLSVEKILRETGSEEEPKSCRNKKTAEQ